ncbi:hypothetical protein [Xenorhabdus szentirmaii]|uniref:Uncharacterized protein n=1 Tax=Xenorhabdus szentirmaii DSM 16338 TaxID=1427518 RepID=W1IV40_9GAMM|nr:hypothetical protein [Xenorhabdus szentirmaii]PHM30598.1 hypothetical protein Xsze_04189 [Xenorhabdus szentirmaii DSM 16338]CDL81075.1 hypothetical protein XSR1_100118 [Xenorhabdus szentirmaii DSM 16338]
MNKVTSEKNNVIDVVTIIRLETELGGIANNNVRVTFKDRFGKIHDKFLLAYPDKQIEGIGVYTTLLFALSQAIDVTLKTTSYINGDGDGYISGIIINAV